MKTIDKKQLLFFILFFISSLLFNSRGILKYAVYSAISLAILIYKKGNKKDYYIVMVHTLVYIVIGFVLAILNNNISDETFKQTLIYLACGYVAVNYFTLYGESDTSKLLDLQLYGMFAAYIVSYFLFNYEGHIYWESHIFAYIFGIYILLYLCEKRYVHMLISIVFMLFDHKRITNLSVILCAALIFLFVLLKNEKYRDILYKSLKYLFIIAAILWIYICYTNFLSEKLHLTDTFTSARMSLWDSVHDLYYFSPTYIGKGIGFVKDWMNANGILGLGNLHNDFLAGYIELGFVGYIIWILSFLFTFKLIEKRTTKNLTYILFCFYIYMFLNFLTDNNYIYISFMLPLNVITLAMVFGKDKQVYERIFNK